MAVRRRKNGKLFYKFLFVLLLVSLGPLIVAGYYMLSLSKATLKEYTLSDQQALAVGLADTVYNNVTNFRNKVDDIARRSDLQSEDPGRQKMVLEHQMQEQENEAFLDMSVVLPNGMESIHVERFPSQQPVPMRDLSKDPAFKTTLQEGRFAGGLSHFSALPAMTIGTQIVNSITGRVSGVLLVKLNLRGVSSLLFTGFQESSGVQAAVVAPPDGFLVAHSDKDMISKPDAKLPKEVLDILMSRSEKAGSGELYLSGGTQSLAAFAEVKNLGWIVYIQKPGSMINRASEEMLFKTLRTLVGVVLLVLLIGYAITSIIVQPIQILREAALRLGEGEFEDLPDLKMPNDEIGELAHTFAQMSDSLKIKTAELLAAKEQLENLNRSLESRVEARTRELKAAQGELIKSERLAAVGQMASVVGHEIRNPLAVINNSVYFIKTKLGLSGTIEPKIAKHISIIESEIQQANGIINEILGFTRTRELMLKPHNVNSYVEDLLSTYPFPQHIETVRQFAPENPWFNVDAEELKQALRNLIGNAVEVMPDPSKLVVRTALEGGYVRIDVADAGPGIPADVLEKIFAPFFTTKARGTGLGLAVVKKVVDRHKGRVDVESQVGKGTTFKLYLPAMTPPAPEQQ